MDSAGFELAVPTSIRQQTSGLGSAGFGVFVRSRYLIPYTCLRIVGPTLLVGKAALRDVVGRYINWEVFRRRKES